jgi:hypothetical protein
MWGSIARSSWCLLINNFMLGVTIRAIWCFSCVGYLLKLGRHSCLLHFLEICTLMEGDLCSPWIICYFSRRFLNSLLLSKYHSFEHSISFFLSLFRFFPEVFTFICMWWRSFRVGYCMCLAVVLTWRFRSSLIIFRTFRFCWTILF